MMNARVGFMVVGAVVALELATPDAKAAPVFCKKKRGSVVVRDPACRAKETPLDLAAFGALGPQGPAGPPGSDGPAGPPGPTAASYGVASPAGVSTTASEQTVVALTFPPAAPAGGTITVTEPSLLHITAAIEMHHSGGTADLPLGVICRAYYEDGANVFQASPEMRMEVFGQSNHNAYVTMPIVATVAVEPGTYDVRIDCKNGFPPDSFPGVRSIDKATLNVIAIRR